VKSLQKLYIISGERGTVALRHEARCTCQCCPGLLSARPMGGRCLCCCGMPHGCDWPAPRRVSSARRSHRGQRNSPGLNAQPGAPARAGASHGACNAQQCSPRLAQMRPSSPPTVHRLLKKHCDESAMNAAPATHGRLVMTQLWGVVGHQSDSLCVRDSQGRSSELQ